MAPWVASLWLVETRIVRKHTNTLDNAFLTLTPCCQVLLSAQLFYISKTWQNMDHNAHSQCVTPGYMHNHSSTQTPKNVVLPIASSIHRKHPQITFFLRIHYFPHNEMPKHNTNPDRSVCRVTPWKLSGRTHLILLIIRVRAHRYVLLDFLCVRNWCLMFDSKLPEIDDKNSYDTLVFSIISVRSQQFIWMEMVFCWHVLQLAKCPKFIMQRTND